MLVLLEAVCLHCASWRICTYLKMTIIVWSCDCFMRVTLLFSYSDTGMCRQVHVNLTVFEKYGCRMSRNSQMNFPDGHEQILHVGKDDSLTCHLNFPKSCVLDSVKWYKVKKKKRIFPLMLSLLFFKTHLFFQFKLYF